MFLPYFTDLAPTGNKEITSYDFFNTTFWFYMGDGSLIANSAPMSATPGGVDAGFQIDRFAKTFYSTILADLGQSEGPNVVANTDLLQLYLTGSFPDMHIPAYGGFPNNSYQELKDDTGPLIISNSTFYSQYICQVPHRRDVGSLLIAVLVADIVFLQALYQILTLSTTAWLMHTNRSANLCDGCRQALVGNQDQTDTVALLPVSPKFRDTSMLPSGRSAGSLPRVASLENEEQQLSGFGRKPLQDWKYESFDAINDMDTR